MANERDTEELRIEQLQRARQEEEMAQAAGEEEQVAQHERRADKAHYLREKLEQQRASEQQH